ncbi:MAG: SP_1767 family glycosyltransferase [Eubacterium sp.]|jgi:glycosyltransferase family protein|nr:SP_1767 family glycosyltransferase [Eubacterium sp.]
MKKIAIFGAGKNAERIALCLKPDVEVIVYLDNNILKWGQKLNGIPITSPDKVIDKEYQFIVIATVNYKPVVEQLLKLGIDSEKLITPFSFQHSDYNLWRDIFNIEELIYIEMNMKLEKMELHLNNIEYEIAGKIKAEQLEFPKVHNIKETIREIKENGKSMSRYGDGELDIIFGGEVTFQPYHKILSTRLKEILTSNLENHIVCLPNIYGGYDNRTDEFKNFFRQHLSSGRRKKEYELFDFQKNYYDSFVTRPYKDYIDKSETEKHFMLLKSIWLERDVTIVEGDKTRFGVGNDLLVRANSCIRILGPNRNAFTKYDELLKAVCQTDKSRLVLIALGPAATVMAYDLAKQGYQALDIGHVDIEYEWFLQGVTEKTPIKGKYVNEVPEGHDISDVCEDEKYNSQIVAKIL